jgi:hypothetical protein
VAGENARARTTDANPGGEAYWIANGDTLKACDIQHDGWGAYAEADTVTRAAAAWSTCPSSCLLASRVDRS